MPLSHCFIMYVFFHFLPKKALTAVFIVSSKRGKTYQLEANNSGKFKILREISGEPRIKVIYLIIID